MEKIICNICNIEKNKDIKNFDEYKTGKFRKICKPCRRIQQKNSIKEKNGTKNCNICNEEFDIKKMHGNRCNKCHMKLKKDKKNNIF